MSRIGTYVQLTVGPWLMHEMTGSPLMVSLVTTALLLPRLVLTLPAGALADRVDRRRLLIGGHAICALSVGGLALATNQGVLTPNLLLWLTVSLGVGSAIGLPSYQTLVPDLVPPALRAQAITLNSAANQTAKILGPSLGGLLVAAGVAEAAFGLNALSFVLVMLVLAALPARMQVPTEGSGASRGISEGLRFAARHEGLRRLLALTALFTLSAASVQALLPSVAADDLGAGGAGFGFLYGVFGAGALTAALLRERVSARLGGHLLPLSVSGFGVAAIAFGLAPTVPLAAVALVAAGLTWTLTMTTLNASVQLLAPRWIRGRIIALYVLAGTMKPVGAFIGGAIGEFTGPGRAVALMAGVTLLLGVAISRVTIPVLGEFDRAHDELEGDALAGGHVPEPLGVLPPPTGEADPPRGQPRPTARP